MSEHFNQEVSGQIPTGHFNAELKVLILGRSRRESLTCRIDSDTLLIESKSMQAMAQVYAAVYYISIGDSESSAKVVDLIGPVVNSFVGVWEKTRALYAYGLLLMRQHNFPKARIARRNFEKSHRAETEQGVASRHLTTQEVLDQFCGHAGTLDPMATGLLIVGKSTKQVDRYQGMIKGYI